MQQKTTGFQITSSLGKSAILLAVRPYENVNGAKGFSDEQGEKDANKIFEFLTKQIPWKTTEALVRKLNCYYVK
jgi:hypothetical protein